MERYGNTTGQQTTLPFYLNYSPAPALTTQDQMYVSGVSMEFQSEIWIPGKAWCHGAPSPEFSTLVTATDSTDMTAEADGF